jgi:hypothetical protein
MVSKKSRRFLTTLSALAGTILGSTVQSAPNADDITAESQISSNERREGDFVIAPTPTAHYNQDMVSDHHSHVSHHSHGSHHSHSSHHSSSP